MGVLQLEDKDGVMVDIYLDDEGNIKVPVPKYFWKVIYDEKTKKGIAIVGVNNPHKTEPNLCTPVEENISWLKFRTSLISPLVLFMAALYRIFPRLSQSSQVVWI